jgi:hypothetical protein
MTKKVKLLIILLLIQQLVFSQDSLKIPFSKDSFSISNVDGIKINQLLIDRKKCYEKLSLEKEYRKDKDSVSTAYKDLYYRMERLDSSNQDLVIEFRDFLAMKDYKYQDMKSSFQEYNKKLKKQNTRTIVIIVTLFTTFAVGFGTIMALK